MRRARGIAQRARQLRHHGTQIAHQRHIHRAVDADGGGVLLDEDPAAGGVAFGPVTIAAEVNRFAQFRAQRHAQIRASHRRIGDIGKAIGEAAALQTGNEAGAARRLDDGAPHQFGQIAHRPAGAAGVDAMAHQQDRAPCRADQPRRLGQPGTISPLRDEAVAGGWRHRRFGQVFQHHRLGNFEIAGPRRAGERAADRLAHDIVGLRGIFDDPGIFDR